MRLLQTPALNSLDELASLAYDIKGPRSELKLADAVAALTRANPMLRGNRGAIPSGLTVLVPEDPGLKPSDETGPAPSAISEQIDKLIEATERCAASFKESSARLRLDIDKKHEVVRTAEFSEAIRAEAGVPASLFEKLKQRTQDDKDEDDERTRQIQGILERARNELVGMRKRFS